jgi:hypothetical protein
MTKTVTTKYNFWLAGYYDDFASARCVADDLNDANARTLDHTKTHFGSALGGNARLNSRFRYSYPDRVRTGTYFLDAPNGTGWAYLGSNEAFSSITAVTDALTHNSSFADWLKYDMYRDNVDSNTISQSKPKHPSSILANRQRFAGAAGDSYLAFFNGHETAGKYYCPVGDMDFSWAAAPLTQGNKERASGIFDDNAGNPVPFMQYGHSSTLYTSHVPASANTYALISFASVYVNEEVDATVAKEYPTSYSHEIVSPAKNNFFIHNLYIPAEAGSSGTERVITYDGPLRIKGLGESFHLRIAVDVPQQTGAGNYIDFAYSLKIGYKSSATYNKSTNAFSDTASIATVPLTLADMGLIDADITKYKEGVPDPIELVTMWADIEVVFDFTANTWKAYANGNTSHFANGSVDTSVEELTAVGWSLDTTWSRGTSTYGTLVTMIDRAAIALPLTNKFDGTIPAPVEKFSLSRGTNRISTCSVTIADDDNSYNLLALTTGVATSEWKLLCFLDNEDRPFWQGVVNSITHKQNNKNQTLSTTIKAEDSLSILDRTLPIWEHGQNSYITLTNHISMASTVDKRIEETTAISNTLLMGSATLSYKGSELGFSKYNTDKYSGGFSPITDSRTQLHSGTPIQMYINEDSDGPNDVENEWEGDDVLEIVSHHPFNSVDREFWVKFDERIYTSTPTSQTHIATYGNFSDGDTFVVKGTAYDGTYTINQMYTQKDLTTAEDTWFVRIRTTDTSGNAATDRLFTATDAVSLNADYDGKRLIKITTSSAHNLLEGDEFMFPVGLTLSGSSSNMEHFAARPLQVFHVESATVLHVLVERWPYAVGDSKTISSNTGMAYDLSKINGKDSKSYPKTSPVLYKSNTITNQIPQDVTKYRNIHARWMRDLPQSTWFKAQFGVIAAEPYWRHGIGSFLHTPFTAAQAALMTGAGGTDWNADGTTKVPTMEGDLTTSSTTLTLRDAALWWYIKHNRLKEFIIDLVDKDTGDHQYIIGNNVTTPTNYDTMSWHTSGYFYTGGGAHGFVEGQIIVHRGFTQEHLNGPMMIKEVVASNQYTTYRIEQFNANDSSFAYLKAKYRGESNWSDGNSRWFADPDNITATLVQPSSGADYAPDADSGGVYHGTVNLTGLKGVKRDWNRANTIYSLRKVDESNGYKHLWALWADMRNDGTADADGGYRKSDFNLLLPTSQKYSVNLTFANQFDEYGLPDTFCDLKVGEDLDIWSLDATEEPFTGTAWEALEGGSNEEPFDQYHNWKDKGGAVCLVDVSRFWNLNTAACGGRPGYNSGGLADFGDYETNSTGFPYLIDNYWKHAVANRKNITEDTHFVKYHKNADYFINDGTHSMQDIAVGDTDIYVDDASQFASSGYGVIQCTGGGSDRDSEKTNYYFYWSGKGVQIINNQPYDKLTGVYITTYEVVTGPKNVIDQLKVDQAASATGSEVAIGSNEFLTTDVEGNFDTVRVYNTPAALFSFRLLMNISGKIKSLNSGTYFAHDKLRYMQTLLLTDNWATNATLPCIWDIQNVPKTSDLGGEDYGSVHDARGQTIMTLLNDMKTKEGNGSGGGLKTFSWMIGRDNRLDFRESYASGHTFNRNNLKVSDLSTTAGSQITNVRVYYNGNSAFADHPEPSSSDVRWRVLNYPNIFNREEALSLAKQEYLREKDSRVSISAEIIRPSGDTNVMTDGGRYGYVADVCRNLTRKDTESLAWWTNTLGGSPFFGIQNALDCGSLNSEANITTSSLLYASTYDNNSAAHVLQNYAHAADHRWRLGIVSTNSAGAAPTSPPASGKIYRVSTGPDVYKWAYDGSSYGSNVTFSNTNTWYELESTVSGVTYKLSVYNIDTSHASAIQEVTMYYDRATRRHGNAYYWYGTNSLSSAIQVVHVDKDTNKVSAATSNELRLAIAYHAGSTAQTATFKLFALDYAFDVGMGAGPVAPLFTAATLEGSSSVVIDGNGMFELTLPSSYDSSTPKVIFSADIDYLRDVMDRRLYQTTPKNAHNMPLDSTYSSFDTDSPFPLGVRQYGDLGPMADRRAAWYAPRLHIVDDLNFTPATTLSYTDTHVDLSNETMVIRDVNWQQDCTKHEKVTMKLEKVESHYAYSMAQVFAKETSPTGGGGGWYDGNGDDYNQPPMGGGFGSSVGPMSILTTSSNINDDGQSQFTGLTSNQMSKTLIRGLKGRADFGGDKNASGATWGVLGSKNTGITSSFDRAIDGLDTTSGSSGSAIATSDGFTLAGISDPEVGQQGEVHSHTLNVRVPNDTSSGYVSVLASISLPSITSGGNAEITTTVTCKETSASISSTKIITQGVSNANTILLPTQFLSGAGTANNTLIVTFERKPAQGNDSAGYQSLVIHNVSVNVRRYNKPAVAQSNSFKAY